MLLIGTAAGPGCVKLMQQNSQDNISRGITTPTQTSLEDTSGTPAGTHSISQIPDLATDALPELTPDPYPAQHALQFNTTTDPSRYVRAPEFKRTYVLRGNSTGLVVNATSLKGPLWISFDVKPLYDCLENPESCRGDKTKSVNRPYFTITVRDNRTREIVAEDGYAREYSSQKDNRTMKIYGEGRYHITMTGESVDVTLYIATGNAPAPSATQASAASSAQESDIPPELREMLYGGL
ncbi:MAG: hypothetical protein LUQ66_10230 [Methanoregula sp.]|nr:hypothetical protein [Methanoregula sp.]